MVEAACHDYNMALRRVEYRHRILLYIYVYIYGYIWLTFVPDASCSKDIVADASAPPLDCPCAMSEVARGHGSQSSKAVPARCCGHKEADPQSVCKVTGNDASGDDFCE